MNHPTLNKQLEETRLRLSAIQTQAEAVTEPQVLLSQAIEEVNQSLEELRVAEEELSLQNQELLAFRQKVEAERRRYQESFEFFPEAYLVTDAMGNIQEANRAAGRLLGVSPGFLIKKPLIIFVAEEAHNDFRRLVADIQAGQIVNRELPVQPRGRSALIAQFHVAGAPTGRGFFLLRWIIRDFGERGRTEKSSGEREPTSAKQHWSAIGRMLAALADTSRDALERCRSGLEKLARQIQDHPRALESLAEVQQGQEELARLHRNIRDYAAPALLDSAASDATPKP
jgi:PAS domain S-box-containing protein